MTDDVRIAVTIDTEEDDWGSYDSKGQTAENIQRLPELQEIFEAFGAKPTYLVNRPPLLDDGAVAVLRDLASSPLVEIGAHCHPWNTPPDSGTGWDRSMMLNLPEAQNRGKLEEIVRLLEGSVGVTPRSFRAGRWGLGPTVSRPLAALGFAADVSVSPFIDWSTELGPDYTDALFEPYRCNPSEPFVQAENGELAELPTTIGYLAGAPELANRIRGRAERSILARLKVVGILDRVGLLARRWLSPESSTMGEMVKLAKARVGGGSRYLDMTFHSCTLQPGATPFVRNEDDRLRFLDAIRGLLEHARSAGYRFTTVSEAAAELLPLDGRAVARD